MGGNSVTDDEQSKVPEKLRDVFESELAIRREAASRARGKINLWALGGGMVCGYLASLLPRLLLDPTERPFPFVDQEWGVLILLGAIASAVLIGALALFLRDRSWSDLRDFAFGGLGIALLAPLVC